MAIQRRRAASPRAWITHISPLALRPTEPAHWVLVCLIAAGVAIRAFAAISWWPVTTTLPDEIIYASAAADNPLDNPQHPAGYPAVLALIGTVTREVAVPVLLQHLSGIASALVLYAAVRRITGTPWPALAPAAVVLLNADLVYLEHTVMSESLFLLALSGALYAAVRVIDSPQPRWAWVLACGVLLALSGTLRSAGYFCIPVVVIGVMLARQRPWRANWRPAVSIVATAAILLLAYATAAAAVGGRFEIAPAQGWHLYGRVAPFADCDRFDPPAGTEALCESAPADQRPGLDYYLFDGSSPAHREFGPLGAHDGTLGAFGRAALLAQPGDYLSAVWDDVKGFYVPSTYPFRPGAGSDLDPQLDWSWTLAAAAQRVPTTERDIELGLEGFFDDFSLDVERDGLERLHDYQRVFRFGATALAITTALTLLGLLAGPRRNRIGVLLFGVGGLAILLLPMLSVHYAARYAVPVAPLLAAG
ncbi:MAG: ArnT family glycosyltransferase, partial [Solirubrobacterales bacterium]